MGDSSPSVVPAGGFVSSSDFTYGSSNPSDAVDWTFTGTLTNGTVISRSGAFLPTPGAQPVSVDLLGANDFHDWYSGWSGFIGSLAPFESAVIALAMIILAWIVAVYFIRQYYALNHEDFEDDDDREEDKRDEKEEMAW